ncbi:hypothetical protein D3C80_1474340 [compost metagenome]
MFLPGFLVSPAAIPTNSVPWKEKPTIIATPIRAAAPPATGPSPIDQSCGPACSPPVMMPSSIRTPTAMNSTMVMTLMSANQYSASPKNLTEATLSPAMIVRNSALQTKPGVSGNQ